MGFTSVRERTPGTECMNQRGSSPLSPLRQPARCQREFPVPLPLLHIGRADFDEHGWNLPCPLSGGVEGFDAARG